MGGTGWLKIVAGIAIVLLTVSEIFKDLFHPVRSGVLSEWLASGLFRVSRRSGHFLPSIGPLSVALVICIWSLLLAVGFALIYWATFPAAYTIEGPKPATASDAWWLSFYYSLEMLTTLGLGDIKANPTWLRVLSACHTLLGFSLVTASITWILLLFPALRRMRTLARKAASLSDAEAQTGISLASPGMHVVISGLAEEVIQARVDLIHFPLLFYFYSGEPRASFPHALFCLLRFAAQGAEPRRDPLVRLAAGGLTLSLNDLAELLGDRLDCDTRTPEAVFQTFKALHTPGPV